MCKRREKSNPQKAVGKIIGSSGAGMVLQSFLDLGGRGKPLYLLNDQSLDGDALKGGIYG